MSPLKTKDKVAIWAAAIVASATIVAALIPGAIPWILGGHSKKYISGTVSDAVTKAAMPGVIVQLQTNEAKLLTQDTTDNDGKFNLPISDDLVAVRLTITASGYVPYEKKLPTQETKNDVHLVRLPMAIGISDGTPLSEALRIVGSRLNVAALPSKACSHKASIAEVSAAELQGDSRLPEEFLKDLISRVKDNNFRYDVIKLEEKRYEIRCF